MNTTLIVTAVIIVSVIGAIAALVLAIASKVFAVPVDETAEKIREVLPGANCGACGFSGCDGYAAALSKGETTDTARCAPGGNEVSKLIGEITGLAAGNVIPSAAVVLCQGHHNNASVKMEYAGVSSCRLAAQLFGGPKDCIYGCVGFGDCVEACPYDAIKICDGVARINPSQCRACKKCINTCPKGIIKLLPINEAMGAVLCNNHDKGAITRKECTAGCIGCMKCMKNCPNEAITMDNNCAVVDPQKCTGCGLCHSQCPVGAIDIIKLIKN